MNKWAKMAVCMALALMVCFGALAGEVEITAVSRDITVGSLTFPMDAWVIPNSTITESVGGYEIVQPGPAPEDMEAVLKYESDPYRYVTPVPEGIHYEYRSEYGEDPELGFEVHDKSYVEKYDGETLIWSVPISEFKVEGCLSAADGVLAYGRTDFWSSYQDTYAWLVMIDPDGNIKWKHTLEHGFEDEYIAAVFENADGSYAVISRGDMEYFCLSQLSPEGVQLRFAKTKIGNYGIWDAAPLGEGYIAQIGSYTNNEHARIVKVDKNGTITDSFFYGGDACYYIADMIEFDGKIYLSGYSVPGLKDDYGSKYEIAEILNYLYFNDIWEISSEELTPIVRDNYTAMLLACDPDTGLPQEFYAVEGCLGSALAVSDEGELIWDVESITTTFYSSFTSSFTIGGTSCVYRYTFDDSGKLISQEKTGKCVDYRR